MEETSELQNIEELEAAREAVAGALKDANTSLLFGEPVDPSLQGYLDVVKEPKDLGTILADIDGSIDGEGPYHTATDVLRDVQLVWSNCFRYNDRPEDAPIVDQCKASQKVFLREWKKAGLTIAAAGGPSDQGAMSASLVPTRKSREKGMSLQYNRQYTSSQRTFHRVFEPSSIRHDPKQKPHRSHNFLSH
jgi:hypothetical protein